MSDERDPGEDPDASPVGERLRYVRGLDGVRAFAVGAVIAYHAGVAHVSGGFLGVDTFFCLSGFLITSLLLGEARHTGTIRLGAFWARRARRLLPALFLVLAFVGLFAWLAAPPGAFPGLRLDSLSTLLYVANWHFILQGSSYFQAALAPSPLTHTWSLAIEEQFYLVWPLVVLALLKLRRSPGAVLAVAVAGALASTAWMAWLHRAGGDPTRLYYGTDTHAMTMLTGAALAAALAILAKGRDPSVLRARGAGGGALQLVGLAGAGVLAAMALKVTGTTPWLYKGGFLVTGVATAAVILSVVAVPRGVLAGVLGFAPIRFVGRISYGLYLWHYPLFLWLDHERTGLFGVRLLALRVGVTLVVATASFYLVERPIRHGLVLRGASAVALTAASVVATVSVVVGTSFAAAAPAAGALPPQPPFRDPVRALLVGDSTALTLGIAIAPWTHLWDVNEDDAAILGCGVTFSNAQIEFGHPLPTNGPCSLNPGHHVTIFERWRQEVATFRPDVVAILAGRWEVHNLLVGNAHVDITQPGFQAAVAAGLTQAVHVAEAGGARVVLLTAPCTSSGERPNGQPWPEDSPSRLATYNAIVARVAHRTGATILDLHALVCPSGAYQQVIDGVTVRSPDGVHFAVGPSGAGPYLAPRILSVLVAEGRQAAASVSLRGSSSSR
ncbi:MAG TPA: acyltransferase family protein [Acidimicrobiales bacterium]|nr:acyltransferase family protein [Acidimicrobiales bacterium]